MSVVVGISAWYHDSAAAIVVDGQVVAAAQEERFSRRKHDDQFPQAALAYCLQTAGVTTADVDWIGFYEKPWRKFDRLMHTFVAEAPFGWPAFRAAIPSWLETKLFLRSRLRREFPGVAGHRLLFAEHHESHAASAFFPSPFAEAAILTVDGVGEWATASIAHGRDQQVHMLRELRFPHSLGLLYSAATAHCGFAINDGEYKLMGLAPLGEPRFVDALREHVLELATDGSFRLNLRSLGYTRTLRMMTPEFTRLFGPGRQPGEPIAPHHRDLAASIQVLTERVLLAMAQHAQELTGQRSLCLAGGVALNCVANSRLLRDGPFDELWIQPAAGDAGAALGVALLIQHQLLGTPRRLVRPTTAGSAPEGCAIPTADKLGSLLGPHFSQPAIEAELTGLTIPFTVATDEQLYQSAAQRLAAGDIIGWFQGRMEFGPRALGNRSILADPRSPHMQARLNEKVKFRESFRPFAPAVLQAKAHEWFDLPRGADSPLMLLTAQARQTLLPAVTHVDGSARVQTVTAASNPRFCRLLQAFEEQTGCPVLVNTSFNVSGEPIVCTPTDAWRSARRAGLDWLAIGNCILQPRAATPDQATISSGEKESRPQHATAWSAVPSATQARWFAAGQLPFGGLIVWRLSIEAPAATILLAASLVVAVAGQIWPIAIRPLYSAWMLACRPLAAVISWLLLAVVYWGVLTPVALWRRAVGGTHPEWQSRRPFQSGWRDTSGPRTMESYFRQY